MDSSRLCILKWKDSTEPLRIYNNISEKASFWSPTLEKALRASQCWPMKQQKLLMREVRWTVKRLELSKNHRTNSPCLWLTLCIQGASCSPLLRGGMQVKKSLRTKDLNWPWFLIPESKYFTHDFSVWFGLLCFIKWQKRSYKSMIEEENKEVSWSICQLKMIWLKLYCFPAFHGFLVVFRKSQFPGQAGSTGSSGP